MGAASRAVAAAVVLLSLVAASAVGSEAALNCGACKGLFDELNYKISKVKEEEEVGKEEGKEEEEEKACLQRGPLGNYV